MTESSTNNSQAIRAKRMVTVDGIRYSLNTGDKLGPAPVHHILTPVRHQSTTHRAARVAERPLPKVIRVSAHQQTVMHPKPQVANILGHSLSQSTNTNHLTARSLTPNVSLWSGVILPSLSEGRTKKSILASLGIVVLSPMTWLYIFLPIVIFAVSEVQEKSLVELYAQLISFFEKADPTQMLWALCGVAALMGLIWFLRHLCLVVAYGLMARRVDHRSSDARHLWLQAAGKIWRFAGVAAFDALFAVAGTIIIAVLVWQINLGGSNNLQAGWGFLLNLVIVAGMTLAWLIAVHRPITRVMLSLTNRPTSFIIVRSFGLIFRNWLSALSLGFGWLLMAVVASALVLGISWATVVYGLLQITTTTGRVLLFILAASLVLFVLSLFTIWSISYWPRAYQWLVRRAYPKQVSLMMSDVAHQKSRQRIVVEVSLLALVYSLILVGVILLVQPQFKMFYQNTLRSLPASAQELLR